MGEGRQSRVNREALYVVVTGDLIASTRLAPPERETLQERLLKGIEDCNKRFGDTLVVRYTVTAGDEFQGLTSSLPASLDAIRFWERTLYPHSARFGVGRGTLSTAIYETTASMDGECFHRSREALTQAKRDKACIRYETGDELLDVAANAIFRLVQAIQEDWKALHYRRFWLYQDLGDLRRVAEREGRSKIAIAKSLERARYQAILKAEEEVRRLLGCPERIRRSG